MPCYKPLQGWRSKTINPKTGKRSLVFNAKDALRYTDRDSYIDLPCGSCDGCRLDRARQWAIRCTHEAALYEHNVFVTLTYNDQHLPKNGSIDPRAPVLFMKRLRKKFGANIRSFGCAEYGAKYKRPHYHLLIFNLHLTDMVKYMGPKGPMYRSKTIEDLWSDPKTGESYGFSTVDEVNYSVCAYVARYVVKKQKVSRRTPSPYGDLLPERSICISRGRRSAGTGGIGYGWFQKYTADVYPCDNVVLNGHKMRPPKYYDKLFELDHPDDFAKLKLKRSLTAKEMKLSPESTPRRLHDRSIVARAQLQRMQRKYENET